MALTSRVEGPEPHKYCGILCTANCFPEVSHRPLCARCWTLPLSKTSITTFIWRCCHDSEATPDTGLMTVSQRRKEWSRWADPHLRSHCTSTPAVSDSAPVAHGLRSKTALEYINCRRLAGGQTPCGQESSPRSDITTVWLLWGHSCVWYLYPVRR